MNRRCAWSDCRLVFLALLLAVGCSGGNPPPKLADPVPFTGTVKLDGQPLAGATVFFHPKTASGFHGAVGTTDESGNYKLEADVGNNKTKPGAIPGNYNVTVSRLVKRDGTVVKFDPNIPPMEQEGVESIPLQFSTVNEEGLSCVVPAAGGTYDIEISAAGAIR